MDRATRRDWGARVKNARGDLSQVRLAEIAGVDQATISKIEHGELRLTDDLKWKIAGALGQTVNDLFPWPAVTPPFPSEVAS